LVDIVLFAIHLEWFCEPPKLLCNTYGRLCALSSSVLTKKFISEPTVCLHVTMSMHADRYLFPSRKCAGIQTKWRKTRKIIKLVRFLTKNKPSNLS
jgi:hypothetical protein